MAVDSGVCQVAEVGKSTRNSRSFAVGATVRPGQPRRRRTGAAFFAVAAAVALVERLAASSSGAMAQPFTRRPSGKRPHSLRSSRSRERSAAEASGLASVEAMMPQYFATVGQSREARSYASAWGSSTARATA